MRRRFVWPLVALAVAVALAWAYEKASPTAPVRKPVPKPVPLRDVPMTIGPAKPPDTPPSMTEGAPPR